MTDPRITLCGRLTVTWDGEELGESLPGRQGRLLFAYLALNRNRPVRRDELVEALWADEGLPSGGEALLAPPLSRLRKALGPGRLEGRSELGLTLGEDAWVDWEAAQAGIESSRELEAAGEHRAAFDAAGEAERILSGGSAAWAGGRLDRRVPQRTRRPPATGAGDDRPLGQPPRGRRTGTRGTGSPSRGRRRSFPGVGPYRPDRGDRGPGQHRRSPAGV